MVLKTVGFALLGLVVLAVILNLYGRSHYDPAGSEAEAPRNPELQAGKNSVEYLSRGDMISANVFLPADYAPGEKRPAIVVTPPHTGVKEQTAGLYAEKLSERGFVTLVFDPRGFGESGGHPGLLSSYRQIEDIRSSVDYLMTLDEVDRSRVFNLGMCAGSGTSAYETIEDSRIRALAVISPYLTGSEDNGGGSVVVRNAVYALGGVAKALHAITGHDIRRPLVPTTEEEAKSATPIVAGMTEYYLPGKPGDVPNWRNELSLLSLVPVIDFSIFDSTDRLDATPVFVAYGTEAVSRDGAVRFYEELGGPKDRIVLEGAGHFDLYWKPELVAPVADRIAEFFRAEMAR